ncbi:hypothetical protein GH714_035044 [Hevea brasiliensis]|uniref:PAZ domain-containing protein n=1 Tax=Hevea brasiliensis TaxID=3981 RepID=A0A6A6KVF1_HEVBR|nr:hypothetical protein GH714_035044 [Hevea brasiliensis]
MIVSVLIARWKKYGGSCPKPTNRSIIARPGFGSSGHPIPLLSNHLKFLLMSQMSCFTNIVYVHPVVFYLLSALFLVSIPAEDNRVVDEKRKIIDRLCQTYSCELAGKSFAYDGEKTLYSSVRLPQSWMEFTVVPKESIAKRCVYDDVPNPGPVIDFLKANQNVQDPCYINWVKAKSMLKNLRVKPRHRNTDIIIGLSQKVCKEQ